MDRVTLITADTARTPDEGVTAGSHSMQDSGTAIANAAANVRHLLAEAAATRWQVPVTTLFTRRGQVLDGHGRSLDYAPLAATLSLHVRARADVPRKRVSGRHLIGRPVPRVDIPDKLTGVSAYAHDIRLPHMLHARVVRGPSAGTRLLPDLDAAARLPGVDHIVRKGGFTALVGAHEWPLVQALRVLGQAQWAPVGLPPPRGDLAAALIAMPRRSTIIADRRGDPGVVPVHSLSARYTRPYLMHGSIGPSCAVALFEGGQLTVWTHSQGVSPLRGALAELLGLPEARVRCIHREGAGCYGHNGADDVAADAALVAQALPGRPIRMQWSREQEHGWDRLARRWSPRSKAPSMRPVGSSAGATRCGATPTPHVPRWRAISWPASRSIRRSHPTRPNRSRNPRAAGDRNAIPLYALPNLTVTSHFIPAMPLRARRCAGLARR